MPEVSVQPETPHVEAPQPPTHPMPEHATPPSSSEQPRKESAWGTWGRRLGLVHDGDSPVGENPTLHTDKAPHGASNQPFATVKGAEQAMTTDPKGEIPPTVHMGVLQGGHEARGLGVDPMSALHPDMSDKPTIPHNTFGDNKTFAITTDPEKPKPAGGGTASTEPVIPPRVPGGEKPLEVVPGAWNDTKGEHPDLMNKDKGNGVVEVPTARLDGVDTSGRFGVLKPDEEMAKRLKEKYGVFTARQDKDGKYVQMTEAELAAERAKVTKEVVKKTKRGITIITIVGGAVTFALNPGEGVHPSAPYVPMPHNPEMGQVLDANPSAKAELPKPAAGVAIPMPEIGGPRDLGKTPPPAEDVANAMEKPVEPTRYHRELMGGNSLRGDAIYRLIEQKHPDVIASLAQTQGAERLSSVNKAVQDYKGEIESDPVYKEALDQLLAAVVDRDKITEGDGDTLKADQTGYDTTEAVAAVVARIKAKHEKEAGVS